MRFHRDGPNVSWKADVVIRDAPVSMLIYRECPSSQHEPLALAVIAKIESEWPKIRANLLRTVHPFYNDSWADPAEGFERLSPEDFLQRIKLNLVDMMDEDGAVSLYFDSDLFGGHTIELFWEASGKLFDATLVG